jgi:hypothetical protein
VHGSWPKCREVSSKGHCTGTPAIIGSMPPPTPPEALANLSRALHLALRSSRAPNRLCGVQPSGRASYWPIVRTTLERGRALFADSLSCCVTISSYFGMVVTGERGTTCTTL